MEASIINCQQEIIDGELLLNNMTISLISDSEIKRLAFFIQTNDSNFTIYSFNMPMEIIGIAIVPNVRYTIDLTEYINAYIDRIYFIEPVKFQIYIRNSNNNRIFMSCPLLDGDYSLIRI